MRTIPPDVLLSWPTPNYTDPVTRGNALLIVNSIFIALVVIVVGLRLYTRIWIKRWFGTDDLFIILALICTIGLTTVVLLANQDYGWDRHVYDIPFTKLATTSKIAMSAKVIFTAAATFTRLSLLFFYYRLVQESSKKVFRWAVHLNVAYTIGIFFAFIFLSIFQCTPVSNYWSFGAPEGSCLNEGTVTLVAGIINCIADFFCTTTPIPLVMKLQMPRRQRVAVTILFSLGFIVTIAGIVRTWYIYRSLIAEYDQTWYAYPLWIAAAIEIDLGVICASAPVLRPLLAKIPFSLSTIASKRGSGALALEESKTDASGTTLQGTKTSQSKSVIDSKRGSQLVYNTGEEDRQQAHNYELSPWTDVEQGFRSSEDAILRGEDNQNDRRDSWRHKRVTTSDLNSRGMTLTQEEENQRRESVSTRSSESIHPLPAPLPVPTTTA